MIKPNKQAMDDVLKTVIDKIDGGTITCEDFNHLIAKTMIGESTPEAIRDRLRRRTKRNETDSHIEPETGHQQLDAPTFAARVQPKRQPLHKQGHGRSKIAHAHSARTQSRTMAASFEDKYSRAINFIVENMGKIVEEETLAAIPYLREVSQRLMIKPDVDHDWLYNIIIRLA